MKFIFCLLLAASAAAQTRVPTVAVFAAPGIKHAPSTKRVSSALVWAAKELNLADRGLPNVAVFFIDRQTAKTMQINPEHEIAVVSATGNDGALQTVYQVWVVDGTTDTVTALAMVQVLNVGLKLDLTAERIASTTHRVRTRLEQEVDVASLR